MGYSDGRHRAPTITGRRAAAVAVGGALAFAPALALAGTAHADVLDDISGCESGGDLRAENPNSSASGRWQFLDSTWASVGGTRYAPRASGASASEQRAMAEKLYAEQGTTPWNASRSCWSGKGGGEPATHSSGSSSGSASSARSSGGSDTASASKPRRSSSSASSSASGKRAADGSGSYTCTRDKLRFDACDPDTLGQVVDYPLYNGKGGAAVPIKRVSLSASPTAASPSPARHAATTTVTVRKGDWLATIAAEHGVSWRALWKANPQISDPHWLVPGQVLTLPR